MSDLKKLAIAYLFLLFLIALYVSFKFGEHYSLHHLDRSQKQSIAVEYMCDPAMHWQGVSVFCGQQVMDGRTK